MVWKEFKLDKETVKYSPIKISSELDFPDCDKEGKELFKEQKQKGVYGWKYANGTDYSGTTYKLVAGKPANRLKATTQVKDFEVVSKSEALDLIKKSYYKVDVGQWLIEKIGTESLKFKFSNGGYRGYRAYIFACGGKMIMTLGTKYLTQELQKAEATPEALKLIEANEVAEAEMDSVLI